MATHDVQDVERFEAAIDELQTAYDSGNMVLMIQAIKEMYSIIAWLDLPRSLLIDWFDAVADEADRFPTGSERRHWNRAAVNRSDEEMREVFADATSELPGNILELRRLATELRTLDS